MSSGSYTGTLRVSISTSEEGRGGDLTGPLSYWATGDSLIPEGFLGRSLKEPRLATCGRRSGRDVPRVRGTCVFGEPRSSVRGLLVRWYPYPCPCPPWGGPPRQPEPLQRVRNRRRQGDGRTPLQLLVVHPVVPVTVVVLETEVRVGVLLARPLLRVLCRRPHHDSPVPQ